MNSGVGFRGGSGGVVFDSFFFGGRIDSLCTD